MKLETSEGKIHSAEVQGKKFDFERPVPLKKAEELEEHLSWLAQYASPKESKESKGEQWNDNELKSFIQNMKSENKHNQILFLKKLAENREMTKEEFDEYMKQHSDKQEWKSHSLGGMKGALTRNINNLGKEKPFKDRKNSNLPRNQFKIKEKYKEKLQKELENYGDSQ